MDDQELVRECLKGRTSAYRELVDRYRNYAMAVALNMLMNRQDAEDACQEAFFKAYRNLARFDTGQSFKSWFYALLYRHCLDQLRKRKRFRLFLGRFRDEQPLAVEDDPTPAAPFDTAHLSRLGPKERLALHLWSREGASGAEIASVLGCSARTAHVHLFRARVKLKNLIKESRYAGV